MPDQTAVRADVWLWAARFFKSRRLCREAIDGGKVELNGVPCKPAKLVKPGDMLRVTRGDERVEITVRGVTAKRGAASVAHTLYDETEASRAARDERRAMARLVRPVKPDRRPDKAARRQLRRFKHGR